MKQRGFAHFILVLIFTLFSFAGIGYYASQNNTIRNWLIQKLPILNSLQDIGWQSYSNKDLGIELKVPSGWAKTDYSRKSDTEFGVTFETNDLKVEQEYRGDWPVLIYKRGARIYISVDFQNYYKNVDEFLAGNTRGNPTPKIVNIPASSKVIYKLHALSSDNEGIGATFLIENSTKSQFPVLVNISIDYPTGQQNKYKQIFDKVLLSFYYLDKKTE